MSRAEVVNGTEPVAGDRVTKQQRAHLEPHIVEIPTGGKSSRPGTLCDGSVKYVSRVPGFFPMEYLFIGYRFR